jgi:hypothetical protein
MRIRRASRGNRVMRVDPVVLRVGLVVERVRRFVIGVGILEMTRGLITMSAIGDEM